MAWSILKNGVAVTSLVRPVKSFQLSMREGSQTLQFVMQGPQASVSVAGRDVIRVIDSGVEQFEGLVKIATERDLGISGWRVLDVACMDYNVLLDEDVIKEAASRSIVESDKARITWLVNTFGTKGVTAGTEVQQILASLPGGEDGVPRIDHGWKTLREAIEQVTSKSGGNIYVDNDKRLHHFLVESTAAPWNFSATPNDSTTFGFREFAYKRDYIDQVHRVVVRGADFEVIREVAVLPPAGEIVEKILLDTSLTSVDEANAVGDAYLLENGSPAGEGSLQTNKPGIRPGMNIQITHPLWGLSAAPFRVTQVDVSVQSSAVLLYTVHFGTRPPTDMAGIVGGTARVASNAANGVATVVDSKIADLSVGGGNLVPNSSFEDGSSWGVGANWVIGFDPTSPEEPFQGSKIARADLAGAAAGLLETPFIPVARTDDYFFSAWRFVRSRTSGIFKFHITEYNASDAQVADTVIERSAADTEWTRMVARFGPNDQLGRTPFNAATTKIRLRFDTQTTATMVVDVDGVQAERGGLLTAYAPAPYELFAGAVTSTQIADDAITTPKIAANAVAAGKIAAHTITSEELAAGSVTADKLQAVLIIASLMKTAEAGNRVEFDVDGIRCYDVLDNLLVNIPTDADAPVYVNGQIEATSLLVTGNAAFRGTDNLLDTGALLRLGSYQAPPAQAPVLSQSWVTTQFPAVMTAAGRFADVGGSAMYRDPLGGADGATAAYVFLATVGSSNRIMEFDHNTGALLRSTTLPGAATFQSITRIGADWYITEHGLNGLEYLRVRKVTRATGAMGSVSGALDGTSYGNSTAITTDGTNVHVVYNATDSTQLVSSAAFKRKILSTGLALLDTDNIALPTTPAGMTKVRLMGALINGTKLYLTLDWSNAADTAHIVNTYAYSPLSAPVLVANEDWPGPSVIGPAMNASGNLVHDGTRFKQVVFKNGVVTVYQYENWTWTTESPRYWVAYTWFDSNGAAHETTISPMANIVMQKRKRLTITTAPLPGSGGADEPNSKRIYMTRGATTPLASDLDLEATITGASHNKFLNWTAGGAAPPASNEFSSVAGVGAIESTVAPASGGWGLRGDGTIDKPRLSFPVTVSGGGTATFATTGWYTRIGDMVFVHVDIAVSAVGSGAGLVTFNLPAASVSGVNQTLSGWITGSTGNAGPAVAQIAPGASATAAIFSPNGTTVTGAELDSTAGRLRFNGFYYAA